MKQYFAYNKNLQNNIKNIKLAIYIQIEVSFLDKKLVFPKFNFS